ncbi:hypothetical protein PIROE2DRAFT_8750 [Piromyces sp. E2]|nr:hypothetical protein PIROE2DRAFT_8750 [Piromyces sp. E2]|eukprot:OUM64445.1 hypothetical protein PIROE2DRAFT_8750 [Piromyces sp. E2]
MDLDYMNQMGNVTILTNSTMFQIMLTSDVVTGDLIKLFMGEIVVYSNSDFVGDIKDRKSTSGYIVLMNNDLIMILYAGKQRNNWLLQQLKQNILSCVRIYIKDLKYSKFIKKLINFNEPVKVYTNNFSQITIKSIQ